MHTLASPPELTYKLGKHTGATKAVVLQSKDLYKKNDHSSSSMVITTHNK
jgi:hypothetical protein